MNERIEASPASPSAMQRAARLLGRALRRRCPNCGARGIFRNYLQARDRCPACRFLLDRGEPDFFVGGYTINLIVAELMVVGGGIAVAALTWPEVPWTTLMYGLAGMIVLVPIVTYPWSQQLWLAVDLIFRPAGESDFMASADGETADSPGAG